MRGGTYTTFDYTSLTVEVPDPSQPIATVWVTIRNRGDRAGSDVVQVYVEDVAATVTRPRRELKGFTKTHLQPGEERTITLHLDKRSFAFWGPDGWVVEPGDFVIHAGRNVLDLPLAERIELSVPAPVRTLNRDSTLEEWLAIPAGAQQLQALMASLQGGSSGMGVDMLKVIGNMPLRKLLAMFPTEQDGERQEATDRIDQMIEHVKAKNTV